MGGKNIISYLYSLYQLWQDPLKQQWKVNTSVQWALNHWISKGMIRLRMFENGKTIIDATVRPENMQGGRLGVFAMSQEKVHIEFEDLNQFSFCRSHGLS